jgi:hypothetical protein
VFIFNLFFRENNEQSNRKLVGDVAYLRNLTQRNQIPKLVDKIEIVLTLLIEMTRRHLCSLVQDLKPKNKKQTNEQLWNQNSK